MEGLTRCKKDLTKGDKKVQRKSPIEERQSVVTTQTLTNSLSRRVVFTQRIILPLASTCDFIYMAFVIDMLISVLLKCAGIVHCSSHLLLCVLFYIPVINTWDTQR